MADDKEEARKRRREREDEIEEREKEERVLKSDAPVNKASVNSSTEKVEQWIQQAGVLIEQLNNLYQMYVVGVEQFPPIEKRKQLEQMMNVLQVAQKATPSAVFKYNGIHTRFVTYRERWDRLIKDLESGKIKRITGPKKGR